MEIQAPLNCAQPRDYFILQNRLYVFPYLYEYQMKAPPRWRKKTILDAFSNEFTQYSRDYWIRAVNCGRICVNGRPAKGGEVVIPGHTLTHISHRHEHCVLAELPVIIYSSDEAVVVSKAAGIPVHPCGRFRFNSLVAHLAAFTVWFTFQFSQLTLVYWRVLKTSCRSIGWMRVPRELWCSPAPMNPALD